MRAYVVIQVEAKRISLERGSWNLKLERVHLILGTVITVVVFLLLIASVQQYWIYQANLVSDILRFAKVPHSLFLLGPSRGTEFLNAVPPVFVITKMVLPRNVIFALIGITLVTILVVAGLPRLSPPVKIVIGFILTPAIVNLIYEILHPGQPWPLDVDWLTSGIVIMPLILIVFNAAIFPVQGPLVVKVTGLAGCLLFSFVWSTLRLSLALSSLFYWGTFTFMFLEYLPCAFVDFIYMLFFYSMVMHRLAISQQRAE